MKRRKNRAVQQQQSRNGLGEARRGHETGG
jgi:hypothetical protein